jgi:pimeloyl-ACP methyl ester carboxylesterase
MDLTTVTRTVRAGGLDFPVADHGEGPAVLLLHGFPDSRHLWRHQVPALARAGFRALAPDLRGFGDAPKPTDVASYSLARVTEDVAGILDALGIERVHVVGHDWGAVLAWLFVAGHEDRVASLTALTVGYPGTSGTRSLEQLEKAWYCFFFQSEGVAEEWLRRDDWSGLRTLLRGGGDLERYTADLARPGALTAALNWYRANATPASLLSVPDLPPITVPVLGIWADGDAYLTEAHVKNSREKVVGPWKYVRMEGASHWLMLDRPAEFNRLLIDFVSEVEKARAR